MKATRPSKSPQQTNFESLCQQLALLRRLYLHSKIDMKVVLKLTQRPKHVFGVMTRDPLTLSQEDAFSPPKAASHLFRGPP
jgi:hypothetical protein